MSSLRWVFALLVAGAFAVGCTTSTEVGRFNSGEDPAGGDGQGSGGGSGGLPGEPGSGGEQPGGGGTGTSTGIARIRVLHVAREVGNIDLCLVAGSTTIGPVIGTAGISSGASRYANAGYFAVPGGTYQVYAVGGGLPCTTKHLLELPGTVELADKAHVTFLALGDATLSQGMRMPQLASFVDDVVPNTGTQDRKIRFVHAAAEFGGALDLEWKVYGENSYQVAFDNAAYGDLAQSSALGAMNGAGYATTYISKVVGSQFVLRTEGITSFGPPNTFRTMLARISLPATKNLTIVAFGNDEPLRQSPSTDPAFLICPDEDDAKKPGGAGACEFGLPL